MTTDPIVIPLDERAAKLLLEQRDKYIRQSAETRDGKVPDFRKRAIVGDASWRYRGSLDALKKRVGETLTGAKSVEVVCPYLGDENRISVTTYASQTPDPTATTAAIVAEIPAWMRATIVTNAAGQSYANMAADYADYSTMTATSKTYGTLSQEV